MKRRIGAMHSRRSGWEVEWYAFQSRWDWIGLGCIALRLGGGKEEEDEEMERVVSMAAALAGGLEHWRASKMVAPRRKRVNRSIDGLIYFISLVKREKEGGGERERMDTHGSPLKADCVEDARPSLTS